MNTANILRVADAIESHSIPNLGFNMAVYSAKRSEFRLEDHTGQNCGTVACIGGWVGAIFQNGAGRGSRDAIVKFFEVDDERAAQIAYAGNYPAELCDDDGDWFKNITAAQAIRMLRRLAATGEVVWEA